jgi:tRNA(adenine34) deaminase
MNEKNNDIKFMKKALDCATAALNRGDFPVGCVITYDNHIISSGERTVSEGKFSNELDHAEIHAISNLTAKKDVMNWDINQCTIYSSLEPCLMCFGAILNHKIPRIVYAFEDAMGGGTSLDRSHLPPLYASFDIEIVSGICRQESLLLFQTFFNNPNNRYLADSFFASYVDQLTSDQNVENERNKINTTS